MLYIYPTHVPYTWHSVHIHNLCHLIITNHLHIFHNYFHAIMAELSSCLATVTVKYFLFNNLQSY